MNKNEIREATKSYTRGYLKNFELDDDRSKQFGKAKVFATKHYPVEVRAYLLKLSEAMHTHYAAHLKIEPSRINVLQQNGNHDLLKKHLQLIEQEHVLLNAAIDKINGLESLFNHQ